MVKVRFENGVEAVVHDLVWTCENKNFAALLNTFPKDKYYSPAYDDPNYKFAMDMIDKFGGEIITRDIPPDDGVVDRVY